MSQVIDTTKKFRFDKTVPVRQGRLKQFFNVETVNTEDKADYIVYGHAVPQNSEKGIIFVDFMKSLPKADFLDKEGLEESRGYANNKNMLDMAAMMLFKIDPEENQMYQAYVVTQGLANSQTISKESLGYLKFFKDIFNIESMDTDLTVFAMECIWHELKDDIFVDVTDPIVANEFELVKNNLI